MRSLLALFALALMGILAAPETVIAANLPGELCNKVGSAACNCYKFGARTTPGGTIPKCVDAAGEIPCPIGTTTMADNNKNIVACLLDENNYPRWKSMTTPASPNCPDGSLLKMHNSSWKCYREYALYGGMVYCNPGDERIRCIDTGHGRNHGITLLPPNGCVAWEGPANYGGAGCRLECGSYIE